MRESILNTRTWENRAIPVRGVAATVSGVAILSVMFLLAAIWNGFPLVFYDTGAYVLEGLGHVFVVERAPPISARCPSVRPGTSIRATVRIK